MYTLTPGLKSGVHFTVRNMMVHNYGKNVDGLVFPLDSGGKRRLGPDDGSMTDHAWISSSVKMSSNGGCSTYRNFKGTFS